MKINSTTAYIVNKNTVKQLIDDLLKSGYTLKDDIRLVTKTSNFGRMIEEGYYIPIFPRHPHVQYSSSNSKLSLAEIEIDVIKNYDRVDEVVIYNPKVIL